ncbi:IS30 family transposase [Mammaliicoccus sciuri]|uniref:IS30 family transposase n=1 Tax=Mammaliicoccus sciuri TaxID=1296 RepID=UPI003F56ACE5
MTQLKDNINSRVGKHLTYEERVKIEGFKEQGYSNREIARILKRAPQTINNAVNQGTVRTIKQRQIHNDKVYEYDKYTYSAEADHQTYLRNRQYSGRCPKWLACDSFINWADEQMLEYKWSPDMVVGYAKRHGLFSHDLIPCTSTLYNWINRGIMKTKNIDLLEQVSRKPRNDSPIHRENRRVLGPSIEERPKEVDSRKHFGHWEIDTLLGAKDKDDPVLLTLVERKTRFEIMLKIDRQDQQMVDQAMNDLYEQLGDQAENIFKTITSDNGSEFAGIYELLTGVTDVFFARPYASHERGTKENQHKLVRRFIPKGKRLKEISTKTINRIEWWMNNIPRKILNYRTAYEAFLKEIQLLVS